MANGDATELAHIDALIADARSLARTGGAQRALALASDASALAQRAGDARRAAGATEALADAHSGWSAYPEALTHYIAALASWRRQDDRAGQLRCLQSIASVDIHIGDYALAMGRLEEALRLLQGSSDAAAEAAVYHRLGMVYARLNDVARARILRSRARAAARARRPGGDRGEPQQLRRIVPACRSATRCCAQSARSCARPAVRATWPGDTAARNSCWRCSMRPPMSRARSASACGSPLPSTTGVGCDRRWL